MAGARRYRFVGAWALVQVVVGCLAILAAALVAFAVLSPWSAEIVSRVPEAWRGRLAPVAVAVVSLAVILGASLVLSGQMLLLLRDIHRHVARLDARDARRERAAGRSPDRRGVTSRLLPRR
ncbi:MAG: hypothetical protein ACRELZ_18870 [Candidatus Rokuibacteriota bacterium]